MKGEEVLQGGFSFRSDGSLSRCPFEELKIEREMHKKAAEAQPLTAQPELS